MHTNSYMGLHHLYTDDVREAMNFVSDILSTWTDTLGYQTSVTETLCLSNFPRYEISIG